MGKDLLNAMKKHVTKLPLELAKQDIVAGRVAFYHNTDISPLSKDGWIFCHLEEIFLGCERGRNGINFNTSYSLKFIQGLVNMEYEYCLNEMIATNTIILECKLQGRYELYDPKRSKKIRWISYTKEYLEKGINLQLFYLEEFGFEWIESFKNNILSFTLVRK